MVCSAVADDILTNVRGNVDERRERESVWSNIEIWIHIENHLKIK